MGGSIIESTRIPDVGRIHVFCAKQKPFEIRYRSFEECVEEVVVTHSPRYMLDMDVAQNNSLFKKLGKTHDEIRQMPNPRFQEEFSNQDLAEEKFESNLVNTNLKFWKDLSSEDKELIKVEMLVASPIIVEGKYEYACQWLLQRKGAPLFAIIFLLAGRLVSMEFVFPRLSARFLNGKGILQRSLTHGNFRLIHFTTGKNG